MIKIKFVQYLFMLLILFQFTNCKRDTPFEQLDILDKIKTFEGVTVTELQSQNGYPRVFQIDMEQPVDHNNPDGQKFTQRMYLSHIDDNSPMVFAPNGYQSNPNYIPEIAGILNANCLNVSHRYFNDSKPNPENWEYLTIKQSADDHHRIVELFRKIYKGKWISSGASKSGLTALFHRRYYPNDVDATIAYVAPFIFGPKDQRYPEYLRNLGDPDCFQKLTEIQQYVLKHKSEILPLIDAYIKSGSYHYSLDRELLLELHIMDYPFTFWQYFNLGCNSIPDTTTSTTSVIFNHYNTIVPLSSFSDENTEYYKAFTYQSVTELGAPAYQTDYMINLLTKIDPNDPGNPNYELLAPFGPPFTFNYNTITDIYNWLKANGDRIVYIYGKNDPWSAGAIELSGQTDAVFIMQANANHNVKIKDLDDKELVYSALENWLSITINRSTIKSDVSQPAEFKPRW